MRDVPAAPTRPSSSVGPRTGGRARIARGRRTAAAALGVLVVALSLAAPGLAAAEPGPRAAWDGFPADERPEYPVDGLVVPTDTVVSPPAPGFVPSTDPPRPGQIGFRYTSPTVAYGLLNWSATRTGQASGVTVTWTNLRTGWRYATTTDAIGRYRLRIADGSYDVTYSDPRLPYGVVSPMGDGVANATNVQVWDGGLASGMFDGVVARPRYSCLDLDRRVVPGVEGWAPGADPATTTCENQQGLQSNPQTLAFMLALTTQMADWGRTGRDALPPAKAGTPSPLKPGSGPTPAPVAARPVAGLPRVARSLRASTKGTTVRVTCPTGTSCAGRLSLVPRAPARRAVRGRVLARGDLRPGATSVRLRLTAAGRRATRRGAAPVTVVWTPAGGKATAGANARLRATGR